VRIKVTSPREFDPASENPNGGGVSLYFATKSSSKRKEKISDMNFPTF